VFAVYGRSCRCGRSDVPLEVHHVSGDPTDNRERAHHPESELHRCAAPLPRPVRKISPKDPDITQSRDLLELESGTLNDLENLLRPRSHFRSPAVHLSKSRKLGVLLPHNIGADESTKASPPRRFHASSAHKLSSTFSCDITYSRSPAVLRASARVQKT
jgi:hypothetical protein